MRACSAIAALVILGASCAAAQSTYTRSATLDLNGTWRDERGQPVKITQNGGQVTLTTASGRAFSGTLSGPLLELQHALAPEEMANDVPLQVRELSTGQPVTIKSVVSPDGNEIKGTYTGKKPRWEEKDGQYSILGWDDVPDESLFNRNGYYISELSIDYYGWEHVHHELQNALTSAQDDVKLKQSTFDDARQRLTDSRSKMDQLSAVLDQKRVALAAAITKASVTDPPDTMKNASYKNTEQQIATLQARQTKLEGYFDKFRTGDLKGDPASEKKLFDEYDQNKTTLANLQAQLQKLQQQIGFTAQLDAARAAAAQAEDDYYAAYKEDAHQTSDFELAEHAAVRAQQALDDATNIYYLALGALNKFDAQGSPRITQVRVGSYYDVSYWTPADTLRDLDKSIAAVQARLKQAEDNRLDSRASFDEAGQRALAAGRLLASKQDWKGGSAIGQALVETGFYAYDVGKAWKNGGPVGALFEAAKKGIEGLVLGPPKFADPDISQADMDAVFEHARDAMVTTVGKRTVKTGTSYAVGVGTAAFLKLEEEKALANTFDQVADVLRSGGTVEAALLRRYQYQQVFRDEAVKNFKKAVKDGTFRNLAAKLSSKMVIGIVKDVAKEKMKQQVANFFLADAFLDYLDADLACRGAALLLFKDNARYYDAHDTYVYLVQLRAEIERQYDPKSHMKINRNQTFYSQAGLPLDLVDESQPSSGTQRTATVTLGGQTATQSEGQLHFKVNASDLKQAADGGVKLEIRVER